MLKIQILGIGCRKSRALKANLTAAIQQTSFDIVVEEVRDINEIVKYQIYSTPALVINGKVTHQGEAPGALELQCLLENYEYHQIHMRKIITPTDFSKNAAGAFQFAQTLARQFDAKLNLLHIYHPAFDATNPYLGLPYSQFAALKQRQMDAFLEENALVFDDGAVAVTTEVETSLIVGFAAEEIVRQSKEVDLIVMGTTGEGGIMEKFFGKVSSFVAQNAHCPVLLIPPEVQFKDFRNIVYASNYQAADAALIKEVIDLTGVLPNQVHFLHVSSKTEDAPTASKEIFHSFKDATTSSQGLKFVRITSEDIVSGITRYAEENNADLIVMGTVYRNTLKRLFHRSATRRMIFKTPTPLLILHFDDRRLR